MSDHADVFIMLGSICLLGLFALALGSQAKVPRVTLLLLVGFIAGPGGLNLLVDRTGNLFPLATNLALVMVGFLLGEKFNARQLRENGLEVLWISLWIVILTALVVFSGLAVCGVDLAVGLILAGVATATDPAATFDVVNEAEADGPFSRTLLGVVAMDDGWALLMVSFMLSGVGLLNGAGEAWIEPLQHAGWEIGGSLVLGVSLGVPMAFLTGRVAKGEPTMLEAVGLVLLCGGLAVKLHVSYLLSAMVMGACVANLARHHERPFHAIENIEDPCMIVFFVLAGAALDPAALMSIGFLGLGYMLLRMAGRVLGSLVGGWVAGSDASTRHWMGLALMPQAGVALAIALISIERFPEYRQVILPLVIGTTVCFELIGPLMTRAALKQVGEIRRGA